MNERPDAGKTVVYTIGHSTRPVSEFIEILRTYEIEEVIDIRTIPRSRHNPQYNEEVLTESLKAARIRYLPVKGLGGLRPARKDSPNMAWRNASFRGFADYMQTAEFRESLEKLMAAAEKQTTAIMCAEAVPWRCHRSLIGDALLIRGMRVIHIMGMNSRREHTLTPWAVVTGGKITYPRAVSPEGGKEVADAGGDRR